jgi:hypothetical protein
MFNDFDNLTVDKKQQLGTCDIDFPFPHIKRRDCLNWKPLEKQQLTSPYLDREIGEVEKIVDKALDKNAK